MGLAKLRTQLRKARSNPRLAIQRSWKVVAGTAVAHLRPGLQRRRAGNIVMFHIGRSGSTVLGGMLDQHPRIYWDGETYHRSLQDTTAVEDPFRLLTARMARAGRAWFGFEMKPVHLRTLNLEVRDFINNLDRLGFSHFIVLERLNYLRKILSSEIAHKSTVFHRAPSDPLTRTRAHIDISRIEIDEAALPLLDFLTHYEKFFVSLRGVLENERTLWLTYEDDIQEDPLNAYRRTLDFLKIEPAQPPRIWYGKTNPFPVREMISNFDEVESVLRGTDFEWMLYR